MVNALPLKIVMHFSCSRATTFSALVHVFFCVLVFISFDVGFLLFLSFILSRFVRRSFFLHLPLCCCERTMFAYYGLCVFKYYFSLAIKRPPLQPLPLYCHRQCASRAFFHCSLMVLVNFSFGRFILIWMRHLLLLAVTTYDILLQVLESSLCLLVSNTKKTYTEKGSERQFEWISPFIWR